MKKRMITRTLKSLLLAVLTIAMLSSVLAGCDKGGSKVEDKNRTKRFIMTSDQHDCHIEWYGVDTDTRLRLWAKAICDEHEKEPLDGIFLIGDYSLDFWQSGGSYFDRGESRTKHFIDTYLPLLPAGVPVYLVPGNHEQYDNETWKEITGFDRYFTVEVAGILFIMWDSFGGDLEPTYNYDGTYLPMDTAYLKKALKKYKGDTVFIVTHTFEAELESSETIDVIRHDERIKAVFSGHDHLSRIQTLIGTSIKILRTGNFSYTNYKEPRESFWGFRDLVVTKDGFSSKYIMPACSAAVDGTNTEELPYRTGWEYSEDFG